MQLSLMELFMPAFDRLPTAEQERLLAGGCTEKALLPLLKRMPLHLTSCLTTLRTALRGSRLPSQQQGAAASEWKALLERCIAFVAQSWEGLSEASRQATAACKEEVAPGGLALGVAVLLKKVRPGSPIAMPWMVGKYRARFGALSSFLRQICQF